MPLALLKAKRARAITRIFPAVCWGCLLVYQA